MTTPEQENAIVNFNPSEVPNVQSPFDISQTHSVNTTQSVRDVILSEDLLAGQRLNGRMSNVRRFFCLFVTFDFLFTSLMWIICVMLNGEYIIKALTEQVIHYNIHTSLFDIVLVAFFRFCILLIFYAMLYKSHWIVISLSTAGTCGFLIAKVLYFDWPHSSQPVFEVLLVLTSFILAWGEVWFLDFRVIPQENFASRFIVAGETERTPLIRSYVQGLPSMYTESIGNFYSPQGTPEGSLNRFSQCDTLNVFAPVKFSSAEEESYKIKADKAFKDAWQLFKNSNWIFKYKKDEDRVYTTVDNNKKTIFRLEAEMDVSSRYLLDELFYRIHESSKWNMAIQDSYKVQSLDEYTDITYTISKESLNGLVSSRDFVNLRHWSKVDNAYVVCFVKTEHPSIPLNKKMIRGENGVGCYVIDGSGSPNKCILNWVVNTDLKLWLPSSLVDKEMGGMLLKYASELRQHITKRRSN
ncbi:steroidogenic acute regulatory protein-like [Diabrotica virgifera virgifera]|uniref:Steroidogenic acute regulatory protein-like n=1 Tax=Diabrotica virgifera virgifera TaxID=50390 RepID=A0ABM5IXQ1_DIAVI|nr:steroidogenic acute regulatory protein-like [Diabrotica virgifera virgifera]